MIHESHDVIIAECSPKGVAALSLVRLSGSDAIIIASRMVALSSKKLLTQLPTHTIHHGWIIDQYAKKIDQILVLLMRGPKTFTGEDTVEFTCHGNPFIVQEIIALAIAHGARLAQAGEFTKRAVLNDKLDLIRAEAINEIISAQTQVALKQSLAQLDGSLSGHITTFEHALLNALALSEVSFEFIDEDDEFGHQIRAIIEKLKEQIAILLASISSNKIIKQGLRIALVGSVNIGKSSLFNTLLNAKRSIVTAKAGTTRDTIEATLERSGIFITLIDTAGLRFTDDIIEQEGIERAHDEAHAADILLLVHDSSRQLSVHEQTVYQELWQQYASKIIPVLTKADLINQDALDITLVAQSTLVSSHTREGIDALEMRIDEKTKDLLNSSACPFLLTQRQHTLLVTLDQELDHIMQMLTDRPAYELISHHLRDALSHLSALTGKTISEQGMDLVFRQFCVGK